ncbi:MAG TPA: hypothetical protein VF121_05985 [Thermoanaerobaculia bacterium]|nr:hypothetical protein [Thermoanaerobaculia bacterium]
MSQRRPSPALAAALALLAAAAATACAAYRHQHAPAPARVEAHAHAATAPEDGRLAAVRGEVEAVKRALHAEGKYACCVEPACNQCLLEYGECHCREAVAENGPCCGECTEAWLEGRGVVEGIDPWELLERKKAQQRPPGEGQPPHRH